MQNYILPQSPEQLGLQAYALRPDLKLQSQSLADNSFSFQVLSGLLMISSVVIMSPSLSFSSVRHYIFNSLLTLMLINDKHRISTYYFMDFN